MGKYLDHAENKRKSSLKRTASRRSSVSWGLDSNHEVEIEKIDDSSVDDCFWTEDELSQFRYDAFVESLGLDPEDYASDCE